MAEKVIRIGTRKSALALAQSETVRQALIAKFPEHKFELFPVLTTGDVRRDKLNLNVEDKKQWIIEIESLLVNNRIEIAVHSAKDVPINLEEGTEIKSILNREDSRDVLVVKPGACFDIKDPIASLPRGCKIGTSSKRRKAQIKLMRPDIEVVPFRGNVNKRIEKLYADETLSAIILAAAGINRLNIDMQTIPIDSLQMLPAVGQGQLLAQYLKSNTTVDEMLGAISNAQDQYCYEAERKVIEVLGADCHSAVGVNAEFKDNEIVIDCVVLTEDGTDFIRDRISSEVERCINSAELLASNLIQKGARTLLSS